MIRIFRVNEFTGTRTFQGTSNGQPVDRKVAGLVLTDGQNTLYAEGFGDVVDVMEKMNLHEGDVVQLRLSTSVRKTTKDDKIFMSTNVYIDSIQMLIPNHF